MGAPSLAANRQCKILPRILLTAVAKLESTSKQLRFTTKTFWITTLFQATSFTLFLWGIACRIRTYLVISRRFRRMPEIWLFSNKLMALLRLLRSQYSTTVRARGPSSKASHRTSPSKLTLSLPHKLLSKRTRKAIRFKFKSGLICRKTSLRWGSPKRKALSRLSLRSWHILLVSLFGPNSWSISSWSTTLANIMIESTKCINLNRVGQPVVSFLRTMTW